MEPLRNLCCGYVGSKWGPEKYRKSGIGSKLFNEVIRTAKSKKMKRVMWQVLDWNQPAIKFYKKYNAHISSNWLDGKLIKSQINAHQL